MADETAATAVPAGRFQPQKTSSSGPLNGPVSTKSTGASDSTATALSNVPQNGAQGADGSPLGPTTNKEAFNNSQKEAGDAGETAEKQRDEAQRAEEAAGTDKDKILKNADKIAQEKLAESKRIAAQQNPNSPAGAAARQAAQQRLADLELTQESLRRAEEGKQLTQKEAKQAYDPEVRKHLLKAAALDQQIVEYQKQELDLSRTIANLSQVASVAAQRSQAMGAVPESGGRAATNPLPGTDDKKKSSIDAALTGEAATSEASNIAATAEQEQLTKRIEAALAKAEAAEKSAGRPPLTAAAKAKLREKLRTSLRAQLSAYAKAQALKEAVDSDAFNGRLTRGPASIPGSAGNSGAGANGESADSETGSHGMGDVIGSTFSAFREAGTAPGFTMRASETEEAVNGLIDESGRSLANSAEGVLNEDSPSLFLRVNAAHRHWEKQISPTN